MNLAPELLAILVCPQCKGDIQPVAEQSCLVCRTCRLKYRVNDGIPVMLIDESEKFD